MGAVADRVGGDITVCLIEDENGRPYELEIFKFDGTQISRLPAASRLKFEK